MSEFGFGSARGETINIIPSLGTSAMMEFSMTQLSVSSQPNEVTARKRNRTTGFLETKSKGLDEIIHTVSMTWEAADWAQLGFLHGELPKDSATNLKDIKFATVPASTYTITDPDITATNAASVRVYLTTKGTWGQAISMKNVAVAPAANEEVQVDGAAGTLTFMAALEGAEVGYTFDDPYSAISTIGYESSYESYGDIKLWFNAYGDDDIPSGITYYFPQMTPVVGSLSIDRNASPVTMSVNYEASSVTGRNYPYIILNTEYATAA